LLALLDPFTTLSRPAPGVPAHQSGSQADTQVRASTDAPAQPDLAWREAVERHVPGQVDAPAKLVAGWSADEFKATGGKVVAGLGAALRKATPGSEEAQRLHRRIDRGVLLHTDIGLSQQGTAAAGLSNVLLLADGRTRGLGNSLHFEFAAALLKLDTGRRATEGSRAWYRAVSAHLLHGGRLGDAAVILTRWRAATLGARAVTRWRAPTLGARAVDPSAFPEDEDFLFDYGCLHEGLMAPGARVALGDWFERPTSAPPSSWAWRTTTFRTRSEEFAVHAEQAFRAFRRVVEMNPRAAEARVRLGHVECVRGSCGSGVRNMRAGAELAKEDPVVSYYAAMFLGQAEEARGRYDQARTEYERAAALFPQAQSPLLALGALADRIGDRPAARRHASRLWSLPSDGEHRYDPWRDYDGGPRDGESLLREVYRLMQGGGDDRR
jgi:tetratricopeptide (TPR) repeat protein